MTTPYSGLTGSNEVVANYIYNLIRNNAATLGLDTSRGVFYGDQEILPTTPAVCIVPGSKSREYNGVGGRPTLNTFLTYVLVYYDKLQDVQQNIHGSTTLAESIENIVHADRNLGGNVVDCLATASEPGVAVKQTALLGAVRITFRSRSKTVLNP